MSTIHLWDNTLHMKEQTEGQNDAFGRKPRKLKLAKAKDLDALCFLSSSPIGKLMGEDLLNLIVWPNSFKEGDNGHKEQYVFRILENDGKTIVAVTTGNIVGFIGYKDTHVRIHSRFSQQSNKDDVKYYFLYYMLEKVLSFNLLSLNTSSSNQDQTFDFLSFFFPKIQKEALVQGMFKKYVYHEYNDVNTRGVMVVNRHIRQNVTANGKIAYRTREFICDNTVTQLIRHTIEFIRRKPFGKTVLHNDLETEGCVQQIIQVMPTYIQHQRQAIINVILQLVAHPYYTKYATLQIFCLRILQHEKLSYGQNNGKKIHGLLIDAAWLWEEYVEYVAKVLVEKGTGLKHYIRNSRFHLYKKSDGGKSQQIIPDYLDEENHLVANAKYIPLHVGDQMDSDHASTVYYKTIMYMYRFKSTKFLLIYPINNYNHYCPKKFFHNVS